jgi:hypothetical protein
VTRKKAPPKKRNPVVREVIANPKRNAGQHQPKKPSKREQKKLDELEAYLKWSLAFKARMKKAKNENQDE